MDNIPKILYKYRTWSDDYHKDLIIKDEIYFASPIHFNDPFDCKVHMRPEQESDEKIRIRLENNIDEMHPNLSKIAQREKIDYYMTKRFWEDPKNLEIVKNMAQDRNNNIGFFSLTTNNQNNLMWSHYADSHKGFCVGFNTNKLDNYFIWLCDKYDYIIDFIKVKYNDNASFLDSNDNDEEYALKHISSKEKLWKYEDEYRCYFLENADVKMPIPENIIESVYLGSEMPLDNRQEIRRILSTKPYRIKLYQATLEKDSFGLQFTEVKF